MTAWDKLVPHLVHDVRALVRKGLSCAQLVEREAVLEPATAALLRSCIEAQRDLDYLATRIVALADAERQRSSEEFMDLDVAILGAKLYHRNLLETLGATFAAVVIPTCCVPDKIQPILVELIGNSIRYRHPERPLAIRVEALEADDRLRISVHDNGSGWNPAYQTKLMQPFERLDTVRGGFGLGLAIAVAHAESVGGQLLGESGPSGSCFVIEVPSLEKR